jgi:hypothetical protein
VSTLIGARASTESSRSKNSNKFASDAAPRAIDTVAEDVPAAAKGSVATSAGASDAALLRSKLTPVFAKFDADGSGFIDTAEMRSVLTAAQIEMSEEQLSTMMNEADPDGSGAIDLDEFVTVLKKQMDAGGGKGGNLFSVFTSVSTGLLGLLNPISWFMPPPSPPPPPPPPTPPPGPRSPVRAYSYGGAGEWSYGSSKRGSFDTNSATAKRGMPPRAQQQSPHLPGR